LSYLMTLKPHGEGDTQAVHARPAVVDVLLKTAPNDQPKRIVASDVLSRRRGWIFNDAIEQQVVVAIVSKWRLVSQRLVQRHAQRPDIRAMVDVHVPTGLLGGHVGRAAEQGAGLGDAVVPQVQVHRDAKVQYLGYEL